MITAKEFVDDLIKNGTEISNYDITDQVDYLFTEIKINFKNGITAFFKIDCEDSFIKFCNDVGCDNATPWLYALGLNKEALYPSMLRIKWIIDYCEKNDIPYYYRDGVSCDTCTNNGSEYCEKENQKELGYCGNYVGLDLEYALNNILEHYNYNLSLIYYDGELFQTSRDLDFDYFLRLVPSFNSSYKVI